MPHLLASLTLLLTLLLPLNLHAASDTDAMLAQMSTEEKVGQLFTVFFKGNAIGEQLTGFINNQHIGGIILYDIAGNVSTPAQVAKLTASAQNKALASGTGIPLFVSVDQEGGRVARLRKGFTVMPPNMAVAATGDPDNASRAAGVMAHELKEVGINMSFSPVVDVNSNPDNPIIGVRSFGDTTDTVIRYGTRAIETYENEGTIAVAKHFPGHGDTGYDSHLQLPTVPHSRHRLEAVELAPFKAAISAGVPAIMTAHVQIPALEPRPGIPATLSRKVLTDLLRNELGFTGLIVTDSMGMGAISKNFGTAQASVQAFQAGADVLLFGADKGFEPEDFIPAWEAILQAVNTGEITQERLNASVRRILIAKQRYGIAPQSTFSPKQTPDTGTPTHLATAQSIANASLVASGPLPQTNGKTLILWPRKKRDDTTSLKSLPATDIADIPRAPSAVDIAAALSKAMEYSRVILCIDRAVRYEGQRNLAQAIARRFPSQHAAVLLGAPYDIAVLPPATPWLAAWSRTPSSIKALAAVLSGNLAPFGHLPIKKPVVAR